MFSRGLVSGLTQNIIGVWPPPTHTITSATHSHTPMHTHTRTSRTHTHSLTGKCTRRNPFLAHALSLENNNLLSHFILPSTPSPPPPQTKSPVTPPPWPPPSCWFQWHLSPSVRSSSGNPLQSKTRSLCEPASRPRLTDEPVTLLASQSNHRSRHRAGDHVVRFTTHPVSGGGKA